MQLDFGDDRFGLLKFAVGQDLDLEWWVLGGGGGG